MTTRRRYDLSNKTRKAIRDYKNQNGPTLAVLQKWYIGKYNKPILISTLSGVLSPKYAHLDSLNPKDKSLKVTKRQRKPQWPELDRLLWEWQLHEESQGRSTTTETLMDNARSIWLNIPSERKINHQTGERVKEPDFSLGWLNKFKARHKIRNRKMWGEAKSVPKIAHEAMKRIRFIAKDYDPKDVYNMDESGLFWKRGPSKGFSSVALPGPKEEKQRITITLCANADGTDKLPPHYIGTAKNPRAFTAKEKATKKWLWTSNKSAWMTKDKMKEWMLFFIKHVKKRKVLLLMDNFSGHVAAILDMKIPKNVRIEFLPANSTSMYQALDQGIIHNVKLYYRKRLLREEAQFHVTQAEIRASGVVPTLEKLVITVRDAVWWFHEAWTEDVKTETIENCFKKSSLFDENYPVALFDPPEPDEEFIELYEKCVQVAGIQDAMSPKAFANPDGEDTLPISANPTIPEFVAIHLSHADHEEGKSKSDQPKNPPEKPRIKYSQGIQNADELLYLMSLLECDFESIKIGLRETIHVLSKRINERKKQQTIDAFCKEMSSEGADLGIASTSLLSVTPQGTSSIETILSEDESSSEEESDQEGSLESLEDEAAEK